MLRSAQEHIEAEPHLAGIKVLDADEDQREWLMEMMNEAGIDMDTVTWTTREAEDALVQTPQEPETLIPEVWAERRGIKVVKPQGWAKDDKSFYEPITEAEWEQRVALSSVVSVPAVPREQTVPE